MAMTRSVPTDPPEPADCTARPQPARSTKALHAVARTSVSASFDPRTLTRTSCARCSAESLRQVPIPDRHVGDLALDRAARSRPSPRRAAPASGDGWIDDPKVTPSSTRHTGRLSTTRFGRGPATLPHARVRPDDLHRRGIGRTARPRTQGRGRPRSGNDGTETPRRFLERERERRWRDLRNLDRRGESNASLLMEESGAPHAHC